MKRNSKKTMKIKLLYNICHCSHDYDVRNVCHYSVFVKGATFKAEKLEEKPIGCEWCSALKSHKESDEESNTDTPGYLAKITIPKSTKTIDYWIPLYLAEEITEGTIEKEAILIKPITKRLSIKDFLKEIQKY